MIIPGNQNASLSQEWYPWVKTELEKLGIKTIAKNMPNADLARRQFWIPFIEQQLEGNEKSIVIGHSSGAVAALRYLEDHKLEGVVLIGACYTDLGDEHEKKSGYYDDEWQWDKIKQNAKWIVQFASQDDPYIPISEARFVHEKTDAEYHEYNDRGHFWGGVREFPEIIEAIKRKLKIK